MVVGLVRHFKVNCVTKNFMTSQDFEEWVKLYDNSGVIENKFHTGNIEWHRCFSSDLLRAVRTSKSIFSGTIAETPLLREVPMSAVFKTRIKLPYVFWCISGRMAWFFQHKSQKESKKETHKRAKEFLDNIIENDSKDNVLIVCHGFFMRSLQQELKKRKFIGQSITRAKNGSLYIYDNN